MYKMEANLLMSTAVFEMYTCIPKVLNKQLGLLNIQLTRTQHHKGPTQNNAFGGSFGLWLYILLKNLKKKNLVLVKL